jgi:hypothetical protein
MIDKEWRDLLRRFLIIKHHEYCVMPNHFHGILEIVRDVNNEIDYKINKDVIFNRATTRVAL